MRRKGSLLCALRELCGKVVKLKILEVELHYEGQVISKAEMCEMQGGEAEERYQDHL